MQIKTKIISWITSSVILLGVFSINLPMFLSKTERAKASAAYSISSTIASLNANGVADSYDLTITTSARSNAGYGTVAPDGRYYVSYELRDKNDNLLAFAPTPVCSASLVIIYYSPGVPSSIVTTTCKLPTTLANQTLKLKSTLSAGATDANDFFINTFEYCNAASPLCETTPPTLTSTTDKTQNGAGYYQSPLKTTLTCDDGVGGSGCKPNATGYFLPLSGLTTKNDAGCKTYFTTYAPTLVPGLVVTANEHTEYCFMASDNAYKTNSTFKYFNVKLDSSNPIITPNSTGAILPFTNAFVFLDKGAPINKSKQGVLSFSNIQIFNLSDLTADVNVNFIPDPGNVSKTESPIDYDKTTYQLQKFSAATITFNPMLIPVATGFTGADAVKQKVSTDFSTTNTATIPKSYFTEGNYKFVVETFDIAGNNATKEIFFNIDNSSPIATGAFTLDTIHYNSDNATMDISVPDVTDVESPVKARTLTLQRAIEGSTAFTNMPSSMYQFNTCSTGYSTGECVVDTSTVLSFIKPTAIRFAYNSDLAMTTDGKKYNYRLIYDATSFTSKTLNIISAPLKQFETTAPNISGIDIATDTIKKFVESASKLWIGDNPSAIQFNYTISDAESGLDPLKQNYIFTRTDGTNVKTGTGTTIAAQSIDLTNEIKNIPTVNGTFQLKYTLNSFDRIGNRATVSDTPQIWIDREKPDLTISGIPTGSTSSMGTVTLSCTDKLGSGCANIYYCIVDSSSTCDPKGSSKILYTAPITFVSKKKLFVAAYDKVNNLDEKNELIDMKNIYYFDTDTLDLDGDGVAGGLLDYRWFRIGEKLNVYEENANTKAIKVIMESKFKEKMSNEFISLNKITTQFLWFMKN